MGGGGGGGNYRRAINGSYLKYLPPFLELHVALYMCGGGARCTVLRGGGGGGGG